MIKRDEIANPHSCLNRAADDEPIFVLVAHDSTAPERVREWAKRYEQKKRKDGRTMTKQEQMKADEAQRLALQMESWRATHCGNCRQFYVRRLVDEEGSCCDNPIRMRS